MKKSSVLEAVLLCLIAGASAALSGCASPGVAAAVRGDSSSLEQILSRPDHGHESLDEVLTNSVAFDCAECVRVALEKGAKPGVDQLKAAALAGREKIARLLIGAGADPDAAMTSIHAETRKWAGGCCVSPDQARTASVLFEKLDRERSSSRDAPVPAPAAAAPSAPSAPEPPRPPDAPSFREAERPDDFALVVGVEKYDGLPSAAYAERDARAAADFLAALGVPARNVALLTGARATRAGLAKRLEGWLPENVDEKSTVYLYFAGLGAPDPRNGRTYLMPSDGDPRYLEQTGYPLKRVYEKLGELKAKRAIVLLDAGFSGAGGRSVLAKGETAPAGAGADDGFNSADGKIALLAAADSRQGSGTDADAGHGLFTARLLSGLDGAAKGPSGETTLKSLYEYVRAAVREDARRAGREQIPQYRSGGTATDRVVLRTREGVGR